MRISLRRAIVLLALLAACSSASGPQGLDPTVSFKNASPYTVAMDWYAQSGLAKHTVIPTGDSLCIVFFSSGATDSVRYVIDDSTYRPAGTGWSKQWSPWFNPQTGITADAVSYPDGAVDKVQAEIAIRTIVTHIRRIQPHVIVTFGPEGGYGHPDHIAVSQFTTAAAICAADIRFGIDDGSPLDLPPHRTAKLHYMAWRKNKWDAYQSAFRKLAPMVDA